MQIFLIIIMRCGIKITLYICEDVLKTLSAFKIKLSTTGFHSKKNCKLVGKL